ncbi:hypothetical protein [Spirillospora sp. CA-294931]|uniref:hypothetical protein n=1 Tax=Spirillospora sp. CA-294931 TaxID=3240042 RepID=UPI003D8A61A4
MIWIPHLMLLAAVVVTVVVWRSDVRAARRDLLRMQERLQAAHARADRADHANQAVGLAHTNLLAELREYIAEIGGDRALITGHMAGNRLEQLVDHYAAQAGGPR